MGEIADTISDLTSGGKHTPGPWHVFTAKPPNQHKIIGIGELTGEGITDCGFGVWRGGSAEALANAHLIAAAPDMLAALQGVLRVADRKTDEFDAVRAAIAKAQGKPVTA